MLTIKPQEQKNNIWLSSQESNFLEKGFCKHFSNILDLDSCYALVHFLKGNKYYLLNLLRAFYPYVYKASTQPLTPEDYKEQCDKLSRKSEIYNNLIYVVRYIHGEDFTLSFIYNYGESWPTILPYLNESTKLGYVRYSFRKIVLPKIIESPDIMLAFFKFLQKSNLDSDSTENNLKGDDICNLSYNSAGVSSFIFDFLYELREYNYLSHFNGVDTYVSLAYVVKLMERVLPERHIEFLVNRLHHLLEIILFNSLDYFTEQMLCFREILYFNINFLHHIVHSVGTLESSIGILINGMNKIKKDSSIPSDRINLFVDMILEVYINPDIGEFSICAPYAGYTAKSRFLLHECSGNFYECDITRMKSYLKLGAGKFSNFLIKEASVEQLVEFLLVCSHHNWLKLSKVVKILAHLNKLNYNKELFNLAVDKCYKNAIEQGKKKPYLASFETFMKQVVS